MEIENELSETTKPRPWIGWLKCLGLGLLILAMLTALGVFWHRDKMASKLQGMLAEIDRTDPGWRLEDIESAREELPEEENSARAIVAAAKQMPKRWPSVEFLEEHFRLLPPNEMMSGEDFVVLSRELNSARETLETAAKLADMPRGRHRIHHERNPLMTLLGDQQESRRIVSLLVFEAARQSQRGDSKKALTACRAAINAARSLGDEPYFISQLVRISGIIYTCQAVERTLGQGEPPPEDMSRLQKLLEDEDAFSGLLAATRGERAAFHKVFDGVDRGEIPLKLLEGFVGTPARRDSAPDWLKNHALSLWRMDTREDNALFLSLMNRRIKEVQLPMHEQIALERAFEEEVRSLPKNAMITRLLLPAISNMGDAFRREHAYIRCTFVALATERFRRDTKAWPQSVEQLCPQYLAAVPLDPYDGKPLHYKRVIDGIIIYSIGKDTVDNGGNLDRERLSAPGVDIGLRLWDVNQRRQPAKPKPPDLNPK